jgi:hypothetical protein
MKYSYDMPGILIWITHIVVGLFLFRVGYQTLNHKPIYQLESIILMIFGILATLYHLHLMYVNYK